MEGKQLPKEVRQASAQNVKCLVSRLFLQSLLKERKIRWGAACQRQFILPSFVFSYVTGLNMIHKELKCRPCHREVSAELRLRCRDVMATCPDGYGLVPKFYMPMAPLDYCLARVLSGFLQFLLKPLTSAKEFKMSIHVHVHYIHTNRL